MMKFYFGLLNGEEEVGCYLGDQRKAVDFEIYENNEAQLIAFKKDCVITFPINDWGWIDKVLVGLQPARGTRGDILTTVKIVGTGALNVKEGDSVQVGNEGENFGFELPKWFEPGVPNSFVKDDLTTTIRNRLLAVRMKQEHDAFGRDDLGLFWEYAARSDRMEMRRVVDSFPVNELKNEFPFVILRARFNASGTAVRSFEACGLIWGASGGVFDNVFQSAFRKVFWEMKKAGAFRKE